MQYVHWLVKPLKRSEGSAGKQVIKRHLFEPRMEADGTFEAERGRGDLRQVVLAL